MKIVKFDDLEVGMVLVPEYAVLDGEYDLCEVIIISKIIKETDNSVMWNGGRALYYINTGEVCYGVCSSNHHTDDDCTWFVVEDRKTLDTIRLKAKKELNNFREHLDECERLIDENVR